MKLGRLQHDPLAVAAVPQHYSLTFPPSAMSRGDFSGFTPGLYDNDWAGDCTAVGLFNAARGSALVNTGADIPVAPGAALQFYADLVGVPNTRAAIEATDGAQMLTVLARAQASGVEVGQQVPLVPCWQRVAFMDRTALARALLEGPVYVGADLTSADMGGDVASLWDAPPGAPPSEIIGGHAFVLWDYEGLGDTGTVRAGTWGVWKPATWRWLSAKLREAYLLTWPQLVRAPA